MHKLACQMEKLWKRSKTKESGQKFVELMASFSIMRGINSPRFWHCVKKELGTLNDGYHRLFLNKLCLFSLNSFNDNHQHK